MVRQPSRVLVVAVAALVLLAVACGGGTSNGSESVAHGSARTGAGPATREVCEPMVRDSVPSAVGLPLIGEPVQSVQGDTFSCRYTFEVGSLGLFVRDLHTLTQARAYFRDLRNRDGVHEALSGLAEGGFSRADGSVVAKKDAMILTVDVTDLPSTGDDPTNVAIDVASTVLGCW